jgi:hypothetical protein
MRDEVEGYARNGGFEHWKLDGADGEVTARSLISETSEGDRAGALGESLSRGSSSPSSFSYQPPLPPPDTKTKPPSNFSARVRFLPFVFEVLDGQLFVYEAEGTGTSEPLETAIPKLEAILGAARLAANSGYQPSG